MHMHTHTHTPTTNTDVRRNTDNHRPHSYTQSQMPTNCPHAVPILREVIFKYINYPLNGSLDGIKWLHISPISFMLTHASMQNQFLLSHKASAQGDRLNNGSLWVKLSIGSYTVKAFIIIYKYKTKILRRSLDRQHFQQKTTEAQF